MEILYIVEYCVEILEFNIDPNIAYLPSEDVVSMSFITNYTSKDETSTDMKRIISNTSPIRCGWLIFHPTDSLV